MLGAAELADGYAFLHARCGKDRTEVANAALKLVDQVF